MGIPASFHVGQSASLRRPVTVDEVNEFARISGDDNPVHLDETYAAKTRFGRRIAHGMIAAAYVSALLGSKFPGPGTIYMSQSLKFIRPVFLDDVLEVVAVVTAFDPLKATLTLATTVRNQHGKTVLSGEAVCLVSEIEAGDSQISARAAS